MGALAKDNRTPLHSACSWGRVEIAGLLLDHGAKADAKTDSGETPLHTAANSKYGSQEDGIHVAKLLLARGVDTNIRDNDERTLLRVASSYRKLEIVRLLLDHGANADAMDAVGQTPLHQTSYASEEAGVDVAMLLLDCCGDVNAQTKKQATPLHFTSSDLRAWLGLKAYVSARHSGAQGPVILKTEPAPEAFSVLGS